MNEPTVVVDPNEIVQRILKIKRGELPPDAVKIEELRAALASTRKGYQESGEKVTEVKTAKRTASKAAGRLDTSVLGDDLFG